MRITITLLRVLLSLIYFSWCFNNPGPLRRWFLERQLPHDRLRRSKEDDRFRPDSAGVTARVASCDHRVRQCCRNLFVGVNPLSSARERRYAVIPVRRLPRDDVCHRLASPRLILLQSRNRVSSSELRLSNHTLNIVLLRTLPIWR